MAKLDTSNTRRVNALLQLGFAFLLFLSVNLMAGAWLGPYRLDLTNDKLFSLSSGTEEIASGLSRPITLQYYFSEKEAIAIPPLFRYGTRVQDLLEEIAQKSDGMIRLEVIDPKPFTSANQEALSYGLQAISGGGGTSVYMGLVGTDDTNRLEIISRFSESRERFLEFDIAKIIYLLAQDKKPKLAVLSGLPMQFGHGGAMGFLQGASQPYIIYAQLSQFYELVDLELTFNVIPRDVDVLLIVHPPELSTVQLFRIDQFILAGNPALIFVDPYAEMSQFNAPDGVFTLNGNIEPSSNFTPLFAAWGVAFDPNQAIVDFNLGQKVEVGQPPNTQLVDLINWLGIGEDSLAKDDPITAFLSVINFASVGALEFTGKTGLQFEPMITTSADAALVPVEKISGNFDPQALIMETTPQGAYTLVGRISGHAQTVFPEGLDGTPGTLEGNINLIVGADADIFEDQFWARIRQDNFGRDSLVPIADNAAFIVNAIDHLSGSEGLISLRARGVSKKPLEKFHQLRDEATRRREAELDSLTTRLGEVQARVLDLESAASTPGQGFNSTQENEMANFRNEAMVIQRNLNQVQRQLIDDIEGLENRIIFLNIFLLPAIILGLTFLWLVLGRRKKMA